MNIEQFKQALLECMKDEEFVYELRGILSKSGEFENLIYDINEDLEQTELNSGNPYFNTGNLERYCK